MIEEAEPRSLEYYVWRHCERMQLRQVDFWQLDYETQLTMICFEMLRQQEEVMVQPK